MTNPDRLTSPLSSPKRRILDSLKRRARTAPELAACHEVTTEAIRQQLADLADNGLVRSSPRANAGDGPGRPPVEWSLTEVANDLFPDRHADLTVSLIESIRAAVGESTLDEIIARRTIEQLGAYRRSLRGTPDKVAALAALRTDEGYIAEVTECPDGDGRLLIEHHCPICEAAATCQGLCKGELELFQESLGPTVTVTREQHLLSGDERCVYRIRPRRSSTSK